MQKQGEEHRPGAGATRLHQRKSSRSKWKVSTNNVVEEKAKGHLKIICALL